MPWSFKTGATDSINERKVWVCMYRWLALRFLFELVFNKSVIA